MAAGASLIRMEGVSFSYDQDRPVVTGVDLSLASGERLGLVGPNGSGKTTLLHLIVGLLRPSSGVVWAFGRSRTREEDFREVRVRAGLVFQNADDQLFCPTVLEDVAFGPLNLRRTPEEARSQAARTLDLVGMAGLEDRITYRLSGGEKRLVALATVLAMEPDVLLLDEPAAGLDEASTERVTRVLAGLPQAMIVVSHQRDFLQGLVHRTQVLLPPGDGGPPGGASDAGHHWQP